MLFLETYQTNLRKKLIVSSLYDICVSVKVSSILIIQLCIYTEFTRMQQLCYRFTKYTAEVQVCFNIRKHLIRTFQRVLQNYFSVNNFIQKQLTKQKKLLNENKTSSHSKISILHFNQFKYLHEQRTDTFVCNKMNISSKII